MQKIRHSVFETNSSSTHSISINALGTNNIINKLPVEDGVVKIYEGEFGWEQESYTDSAIKASYCFVYAKRDPQKLAMLSEVITNEMQAPVEFIATDDGYIDHQSWEICKEAFESKENLRNFIFNPNSVLTTDNDNK